MNSFCVCLQEINSAVLSSPADALQLLRQQNEHHHGHHRQQQQEQEQQQSPPIITSILLHMLSPAHSSPLVALHAASIITTCHAVAGLPSNVLHRLLQVTNIAPAHAPPTPYTHLIPAKP